jgi:hypothetical protein
MAGMTSSTRGERSSEPEAATSATKRACRSTTVDSARFRSVMSRAILEAPIRAPCSSRIGDTVSEIGTRVPSRRRLSVSKWTTFSPRRRRSSS